MSKYFGFISLQVFFRCFRFEQTDYVVLSTFSLDFFFLRTMGDLWEMESICFCFIYTLVIKRLCCKSYLMSKMPFELGFVVVVVVEV